MDQQRTEKFLTFFYFGSALLSSVALVTVVTPWIHWSEILDTCPNYRCNCILYGLSGFNYFNGGRNVLCRFATYASVPVIVISIAFAIYHAYRSCILTRRRKRNNKTSYRRGRNQEDEQRNNDNGRKRWILSAILAILIAILLVANAVVVTDGYLKSCDQYRRALVKTLLATGNSAKVIYERLQCGAIFDFMDYVEPFSRPFVIKDESRHRPTDPQRDFYRGHMINTGIALQIAIVSLWFNLMFWIVIIVLNFLLGTTKCCPCLRTDS